MCGIFGGIGVTEAETFVALKNIQRGNDGITVSSYGNVVLGARRHLVKISNKAGVSEGESDQPYESDDRSVVLVFNGELYNFDELKKGVLADARFTTEGDTEVWLRLYEKFGVDCYGRFDVDSMFSLAILDQNLNRLFVGRDWPGRVPLFYYYNEENRTFVFSSELKGMKTVPGIRLAQAKELPSGHLISLDLQTFEMQIDRVIKANPIKGPERPLLDIGKELHAILHRSAKNRTMGDVPICTMLSGGLDSLLTTYYVLSNIDFNSVSYRPTSYVFAVEGFDSPDVYRAKVAAEGFEDMGLTLREIRASEEQVVEDIPDIVTLFETREIKSLSVYPLPIYYYLGPEMHKDGFKVTIGGHGVDELFGSYDAWKELSVSHKTQTHLRSRLAFINAIYDNMLRRASIIFMERGPIEARFPFLQVDVCNFCLGIDPKWLSLTVKNAEALVDLIQKRAGSRDQWGDKLPWIYDYLVRYLDNDGIHPEDADEHERAEVEKLFWKLPVMVAGMCAVEESSMPFHLLFNAKLRGQHGSGLTALESRVVERYSDLGETDTAIYRHIVKEAFDLDPVAS